MKSSHTAIVIIWSLLANVIELEWKTTASAADPVDFVRDVRPIFEKRCYECHGATKQKSGLRLDVREAAFKGGDGYGPSILPNKAADSPLLQLVTSNNKDERMPPEGVKLSKVEIDVLTRWINSGAVWPAGVDRVQLEDKRDHWSFKPLARQHSEQSVDRFIVNKLNEHGLKMSQAAEPVAWLRRVTFDLTGLPPHPDEVQDFWHQIEGQPEAALRDRVYEHAVDRLLKSPRYGERWAQHWLDVVRFADTHGFEVNTERPNAWPYRDYVIRAFNDDTPYDRFIQEQIVGDALGEDAATGFLVTASVLLPGQIGKDAPSIRLARQDSLDEIVNNIGQTFLGLSIGCARCHDHKFDPITAHDYYAMQAFVAGVEYDDRELRTPEAEAARREAAIARKRIAEIDRQLTRFAPIAQVGDNLPRTRVRLNAKENIDRFSPVTTRRLKFTIRATNNLEPCVDELEVFNLDGQNVALTTVGAKVTASGSNVSPDRHELRFLNDGQYGNSRSWMSNEIGKGWVEIEFPQEITIDRVIWGRDRLEKFKDRLAIDYVIEIATADNQWHTVATAHDREAFDTNEKPATRLSVAGLNQQEAAEARRLTDERQSLQPKLEAGARESLVFGGKFRTPDVIRLLTRGDPEQPKGEVLPAVLSALDQVTLAPQTPEQDRRRALANWIASPQNPLTARVMVNRIWQGHFGSGLVQTPSDFGRSGFKPTHPELLDWLATEFIRSGWSIKHMHRLIVLSQTYRQSSAWEPTAAEKDADVRWLWRYPSRRLEAETLRDAMLAVSGQLNLTMYGRGFDLFDKRGGLSGFKPVEILTTANQRRMIYAHKVRREPEAVFGAFDCPDAGQSTALRRASTTPIQALNLFNSHFTLQVANAFAARLTKEAGDGIPQQIDRAYQLAFNRAASPDEQRDVEPIVRQFGLAVLCRALLNSNEFLFVP